MSPKPFQPVCLDARPKAPRGRPPKSTKRQPIRYTKTVPKAQVSQFTRDRLYNQALSHPAYEGMPPDDVRRYIDSKIDSYIASYPWCFGHLKKDRPKKPLSEAQLNAIEKMRQRKQDIQNEVDAPYVPDDMPVEA
ncbi:MAG: hypothetical protein U0223_11690 [Nitrospira sp.]|nr:hypothetical protein [Nitrospira sp.]